MYSKKRYCDIRELELFLFGGVPETAEQMYERDSYGHSEIRITRKPISSCQYKTDPSNAVKIGECEIDFSTGEFITYDSGGTRDYPISLASKGEGKEPPDPK